MIENDEFDLALIDIYVKLKIDSAPENIILAILEYNDIKNKRLNESEFVRVVKDLFGFDTARSR